MLPSGFTTTIASIENQNKNVDEAFPPMSVVMRLTDDLDVSRGDMIVRENNVPTIDQDIDITVCWMNKKKLEPGKKYILRHTTKETKCIVKEIRYKLDINTLHRLENVHELGLNDIGRITLRTAQPLFFDSYRRNRSTGSLILIDEQTNETVGAGMIRD